MKKSYRVLMLTLPLTLIACDREPQAPLTAPSPPAKGIVATPDVDHMTGYVRHGYSLTLTGTDFGSVGLPKKYDNFDGGTLGQTLTGWTVYSDTPGNEPSYNDDVVRWAGTKSVLHDFSVATPVDESSMDSNFAYYENDMGEVYVSVWQYYDALTAELSENFKLISLRSTDSGNKTGVRTDFYGMISGDCRSTVNWYVTDCDDSPDAYQQTEHLWSGGYFGGPDSWYRLELYWKQESSPPTSNDGVFKVWVDGALKADKYGDMVNDASCAGGYGVDFAKILYYHRVWSTQYDCADTTKAKFYTDECYVAGTQARVEIGEAPTFAGCTHREIQVPNSWSSTSITITVNRGSFSQGDTRYLYVINSDGEVGGPYEVTFGSLPVDEDVEVHQGR